MMTTAMLYDDHCYVYDDHCYVYDDHCYVYDDHCYVYDDHCYVICLSNKKIHVVKKKFSLNDTEPAIA